MAATASHPLSGLVERLLAPAFAAAGRVPEALVEEDFLADAHVALSTPRPDPLECCERIHAHLVFDAVNEALEALNAPPPQPRGTSAAGRGTSPPDRLSALLASASVKRVANLSLAEVTSKVLALMPTPKAEAHAMADGAEALPDDIGAATRMLWKQLAPEWTDYGEDDWAAARAEMPRGSGGEEDARAKLAAEIFWEGREALLLTQEELHVDLWTALCRHVSPPFPDEQQAAPAGKKASAPDAAEAEGEEAEGEEGIADWPSDVEAGPSTHNRIHYDDYLAALSQLDPRKAVQLRSARAFIAFRLDEYGRASIHSLYALACSLTQLLQTRVHLAMLEDGRGRLSEPALETFVKESIPRLPRLCEHVHLQPGHSFLPFYVAHCVRKLHMLLDHKDKRGVPVETLLLSADLAQFFSLAAEVEEGAEDDMSADESNWFSLACAIRIYRQFLDLDSDQDGMLAAEELSRYADGLMTLTPAFVGRLFEVVHTYEGRLDYKGYLDLVVSLQALRPASAAPASEAALRYFWRVLNLHDAPSLGSAELSYFARPAGRERPLAAATARCPGRLGRAPQAPWLRHGTWGDEPRGAAPQASAAPVRP